MPGVVTRYPIVGRLTPWQVQQAATMMCARLDIRRVQAVDHARAAPDSSSRADNDGVLTTQERDVLATCATGRVTHEVAQTLGLPPGRVQALVRSAMVKLAARSKLEAVIIAHRRGEIGLPTP
jgi:DNA-binding NarL/FixJ family response regulator